MPLHKDLTGADLHVPGAHKTQHEDGGSDEISLTGLTGTLGNGTAATTQTQGDSSTKIATTAYVDTAVANVLDGATFTGDVVVPDEAYDATGWDGSLEVPTKNAVRDKIESLTGASIALDDLTDVTITSPATDDVLTYNGSAWVNAAPAGGASLPLGATRRTGQFRINPAISGFYTDGIEPLSGTGSTSSGTDTDGYFVNVDTNGSSGNACGYNSNWSYTRRDFTPRVAFRMKTGASVADVRYWVGLFSGDPSGSATPAVHIAAFRYDTGADGTAFWRAVTSDSSTITVTATTVAAAADTAHTFYVELGASNVTFYVDGVLVATHTTDLPTAAQNLGPALYLTALAAAVKRIKVNRYYQDMI